MIKRTDRRGYAFPSCSSVVPTNCLVAGEQTRLSFLPWRKNDGRQAPASTPQSQARTILGDITDQFPAVPETWPVGGLNQGSTATWSSSAQREGYAFTPRTPSQTSSADMARSYVSCYDEDWTPRPGDSQSDLDYEPEEWAEAFDGVDENTAFPPAPPPSSRVSGEL